MCARGTFACQRRGHWYTTLLGLVFHVQNVFECFADVYVRKAYSSFNFYAVCSELLHAWIIEDVLQCDTLS